MKLKTYVAGFDFNNIAPNTLVIPDVAIINPMRRCTLKTVQIGVWAINNTLNSNIPRGANDIYQLYVEMFHPGGVPTLGSAFQSLALPAPTNNGNIFRYSEPGIYKYDGIYFDADLYFSIRVQNMSLVDTISLYFDLLVEVDEKWNP